MASRAIESHGAYPGLPRTEATHSVEAVKSPVSISESLHGDSKDLAGMVPEASGISATFKLSGEPGNELSLVDIGSLDVVDDDGTNLLVSVLGVERVISKEVKYLVIGRSSELDDEGNPKLAELEIKEGETHIGRDASPGFSLSDTVSKDHATLRVDSEGKLSFVDHSTNGSTLEFYQTHEAAEEDKAKKDGAAVLKASGVIPPIAPRVPSVAGDSSPRPSAVPAIEAVPVRDVDALLASTITGKLYERMSNREKAVELRAIRATDEETLRPILVDQKADNKAALRLAKSERRSVRWENGRIGLLAERASLRKELRQSARDSGASLLKRASMYRRSFNVARKQVALEASVKLSNVESAVLTARSAYYGKKNELGALNFRSKHGGRNTLRENKAIIRTAKRNGNEYVSSLFDTSTPESSEERTKRLNAQLKVMGRSTLTKVPDRHSRNTNRAKNLKAVTAR